MNDYEIEIIISPAEFGMCVEINNCPNEELASKLGDCIKDAVIEQMYEDTNNSN